MATALETARSLKESAERALPAATCLTAGASFLPKNFRFGEYPGLLAYYTIRQTGSSKVILLWKDGSYASAMEPVVCSRLGLAPPEWSGPVAETALRKEPWWKRFSIPKAILGVAALFGALTAIRDYYAELFVFPNVQVEIAASSQEDYASGSTITIPFAITNLGRFGRANVDVSKATLRPLPSGNQTSLRLDGVAARQLAPGSVAEGRVSGTSPVVGAGRLPAEYEVQIEGIASVGALRDTLPVSAKKQVRLWSRTAWEHKYLQFGETIAKLQITLYSGRDEGSGLKAEIKLPGVGQLDDENVTVDGIPGVGKAVCSAGGNSLCTISFSTGPLKALTRLVLNVTIPSSRTFTSDEKDNLQAKTVVSFRP